MERQRWPTCALSYMSPPGGQGSPAHSTRWLEEEYTCCPPSWVVDGTVGAGARNVPPGPWHAHVCGLAESCWRSVTEEASSALSRVLGRAASGPCWVRVGVRNAVRGAAAPLRPEQKAGAPGSPRRRLA